MCERSVHDRNQHEWRSLVAGHRCCRDWARAASECGGGEPRRNGDCEPATGVIEVTLAKAQIRITGKVDTAALRLVLECWRG